MESGKPSKRQLHQADDYHKLKEFYYERYMSQLRQKILDFDKKTNQSSLNEKSTKNVNSSLAKQRSRVAHKERHVKMKDVEAKLKLEQDKNSQAHPYDSGAIADEFVNSEKHSASTRRPLSHIRESRESSRPTTKGLKQMETNLNPYAGNRSMNPLDIAKAASVALEKRCPRMEIPDLHCLRDQDDVSEDEADRLKEEARSKFKDEQLKHMAYLQEMYLRTQINAAQSRRILEQRSDDISMESQSSQLISDMVKLLTDSDRATRLKSSSLAESSPQISHQVTSLAVSPYISSQGQGYNEKELGPPDEGGETNPTAELQKYFNDRLRFGVEPIRPITEESHIPSRTELPDQLDDLLMIKEKPETDGSGEHVKSNQPLDIIGVQSSCKVLEPSAGSVYWNNYLKVGKSKFARTE